MGACAGEIMREVETALKGLMRLARTQGHVTFAQVSESLEKGPPDSEALDHILVALEEAGVDIIDPED